MDNYLITEDVLLEKQHITIINVLNHFYNTNKFIWMLECLSQKHGCGSEYIGITFWDDLDEYDKSLYQGEFKGVELYYISDEENYKLEEFYFYIKIGVKNFKDTLAEENEKNYIDELLLKIKNFFEL